MDSAVEGICRLLGLKKGESLPPGAVEAVKMGTTVATNALLERKGDRTVFVTTEGFGDVLRIGYQNRPRLFDRHIVLPEMPYERAAEVAERVSADDGIIIPLDLAGARAAMKSAHDADIRRSVGRRYGKESVR